MLSEFLDLLYGESVGFLPVITLGEESGQPDHQFWFEWPKDREAVETYINLRLAEDVYVSVALYSEKNRTSADVDAKTHAVYADADTCHPSNFRLTPTISVQTSEGRWHCYWLLDSEVRADLAAEASHRIAKAHEHQGCDKSGWIKTKILRVPGTTNTRKGNAPVEGKVNGDVYSLAEINKAYADVSLERVDRDDRDAPAMLDVEPLELRLNDRVDLANLYLNVVQPGQSWSERLYRLEIDLFRAGFSAQEVYTLAWNAECNKFNPRHAGKLTESGVPIPNRGENGGKATTWKDVLKAEGEYRIETREVVVDPEPDFKAGYHFLTDEEYAEVAERQTFIDVFSDWVGTRSELSNMRFRRSAAFMLLSCVYGDKASVMFPWGPTPLNIWLYTLGPSSTSKKTTVRDLMMEVLDEYTDLIGDPTLRLANDFSEEALNKSLGPRDGKVSIVDMDEVHGFFRSVMGKGYKAGLKEALTDLYNGKVRVSLRMNKDSAQLKRAKTVFNLYGMGTPLEVADVLTLSDFSSGFMMRPLYAVADDVTLSKEASRIDLRATRRTKRDDTPAKMARKFATSTAKMGGGEIFITDAAVERFDQWQDHMYDIINMVPEKRHAQGYYERLKITVMKCAALLAMSEDRQDVELKDLLVVLKQSEWWFEDFLKVIRSVAESDFQREANEIAAYIHAGKDHQRNRANAMRAFSKYRKRQFDEIIESLVEQGRVAVVRDGSVTYLRSNE